MTMTMRSFGTALLLTAALALPAAADTSSPIGKWRTFHPDTGAPNTIVEIAETGDTLEGTVVELLAGRAPKTPPTGTGRVPPPSPFAFPLPRHMIVAAAAPRRLEGSMTEGIRIRRLDRIGPREIAGLSDVLIDCVEGGASVSFMWPMTRDKADAFWRDVAASTARGERAVLVAEGDDGIAGTVQVIWAGPENQPHRADVAKMLVHRRARRRGLGDALLAAAEAEARKAQKTLLVLDTVTGSDADRLYVRGGWQRVGEIPDYALMPDGPPCPTTVFYKALRD